VEQFDTLLPMLTVEEMLLYTAELKRPLAESRTTKRAAVEVRLRGRAQAPATRAGRAAGSAVTPAKLEPCLSHA
jgi:hypothetical protein